MNVGDVVEVEVEALGLDGDGFGTVQDREVRVPGAFAGERAGVRIAHLSKQHPRAVGENTVLLRPLQERRPAPCLRHPARGGDCTGCGLMTLSLAAQHRQKVSMLRRLGLEVDEVVASPRELGYRMSAKRIAFVGEGGLNLGSYKRGSNRGADMRGCLVDHPRIRKAADELLEVGRSRGLRVWQKGQNAGLRAVWLRTDGDAVLLTLVTGADEDEAGLRQLAEALRVPAGVAWSVMGSPKSNSLRGEPAKVLRGAASLSVAGAEIGPLGFLQPNPAVAEKMYAAVIAGPSGEALQGEHAWDLYAGSGATTARLRHGFAKVDPCESHPESAEALGVAPMSAEAFVKGAKGIPELVVANPPRKGLGKAVCDALNERPVERLQLLCCGPEALARDLERLSEAYRLVSLKAFDTLPQTPHVEVVAHLVRR